MRVILRRGAWACLLAASVASGQYRQLATTQDGSRVFFLSPLRQAGTDQQLYPKIFSVDSGGVSLVLSPDDSPYITLDHLQAGADGSWLVYGQKYNCTGGSSCFLNEQHSSRLLPASTDASPFGGNARLSSDGRWAFVYSSLNVLASAAVLLNRETGERSVFAAPGSRESLRVTGEPSVARDGTLVVPSTKGVLLWRNGAFTTLSDAAAGAAVIDDNATTVVYQASRDDLWAVDLGTGAQWPLGAWERTDTAPQISADGRWVLYLSGMYDGPQVFFCARDGSEWVQLTDEAGGIAEAVFSGDGRVAWAVSNNGALLRIDTFGRAIETRIDATPMVTAVTPGAPGSAAEITGTSLAGRSVVVAGLQAPVQVAEASRLVFQTPWEAPTGDTELKLQPGGREFESAFPYSLAAVAPAVVKQGGCSGGDCLAPVAFHEDGKSLVTEQNPARAGEVIHLYGTGFGPVDPPVATGAVTPAAPLSPTSTYLEWTWPLESVGAEVLYCGLAAGRIGYYQLDVRLPATVGSSVELLFVAWDSGEGFRHFQPFAYVAAVAEDGGQ